MSTLPTLDYNYNELEPHIDAQTMEIHHSKHHQAYVSKYDAAIEGTSLEQNVFEVLADFASVSDDIKGAVRNNGGGHINHSLFWKVIGPNCGGAPSGDLASEIDSTFGGFDAFKTEFEMLRLLVLVVGRLVVDSNGKLAVTSTPNQVHQLWKVYYQYWV